MARDASVGAGREAASLRLPPGLTVPGEVYPTVVVNTAGADLADPSTRERARGLLYGALVRVHPDGITGQGLVKVHIGEPRCATRMKPEYAAPCVRFLRERGAADQPGKNS